MVSHLKRLKAPKTWPIVRKTTAFIARPKPSGTRMDLTLPVVVALREMLSLVETSQQARKTLRTQPVLVNGQRVYDTDSTLSFMDVLTIDGKGYRLLINQNNVLTLVPVAKDEDFIIQQITGKSRVRGGKTQINCSSGRNILLEKDAYKVGDSIQVGNDGKIAAHYPLGVGACVLLTGGNHIGKVGTVESIVGATIVIAADGQRLETAKRHAYVIGNDKPVITIIS